MIITPGECKFVIGVLTEIKQNDPSECIEEVDQSIELLEAILNNYERKLYEGIFDEEHY